MKIMVCDRCDTRIEHSAEIDRWCRKVTTWREKSDGSTIRAMDDIRTDLCADCYDDLYRWLHKEERHESPTTVH